MHCPDLESNSEMEKPRGYSSGQPALASRARTTAHDNRQFSGAPIGASAEDRGELDSKVTLGHDPAAEKRERIEDCGRHIRPARHGLHRRAREPLTATMVSELRRYLTVYAAPLHRLPVKKVNLKVLAKLLDDFAKGDGINTGRPRKGTTVNRMRSARLRLFPMGDEKGTRGKQSGSVDRANGGDVAEPRSSAPTRSRSFGIARAMMTTGPLFDC